MSSQIPSYKSSYLLDINEQLAIRMPLKNSAQLKLKPKAILHFTINYWLHLLAKTPFALATASTTWFIQKP